MTPQTDIRFQIGFSTVQLQPSEMTEADLRAPTAEFVRMTHANDRAGEGKLYAHHAHVIVERKGGEAMQGLMQSALFDVDKSDGTKELKELCDAVKEMVVEKMYQGRIVTDAQAT